MNKNPKAQKHFINNNIRVPKVRLIHENINSIMDTRDALQMANQMDLDLVQMNDQPCPTCKLMNYSKFLFEEKRKKKIQDVKRLDVKEIQLKTAISQNDLLIKQKQVEGFLTKGHEVRVRLKLKGRDKGNAEEYADFLIGFAKRFEELGKMEAKFDKDQKMPVGQVVLIKPIKVKKIQNPE